MTSFYGSTLLSDNNDEVALGMRRIITALEKSFVCAYYYREMGPFFAKLNGLWFSYYREADDNQLHEKEKVRNLYLPIL